MRELACKQVLRAAWDIVDIGHYQLRFFKILAKVCYVVLLLLGIGIVIVTVQTADIDTGQGGGELTVSGSGTTLKKSQLITFCLSLVSAFVAAVQAFYNPVRRWQQVRDATAEMQSQIWLYRTRTGLYVQDASGPGKPVAALSEAVRSCREAIMTSADVQETSFHRYYPRAIFKHGQRPLNEVNGKVAPQDPKSDGQASETRRGGEEAKNNGSSEGNLMDVESPEVNAMGPADNHYSPTTPEDYIRLRLLVSLEFYRQRLPRYATAKDFGTWLILLGTSAGALVAYLGFAPQVSIISTFTAAISAWMEFHSTAQKISRYNGIAVALSNILLWWDSIGPVDKASPVNIDLLVQMVEATLNAERGAWLSGPAKTEKDKEEKADDEEKDKKE